MGLRGGNSGDRRAVELLRSMWGRQHTLSAFEGGKEGLATRPLEGWRWETLEIGVALSLSGALSQ